MKKGFTLSEVLITLAIIGVIAAITLPSLMTDTASAQVGPKLAKAVSMFEQGNESLLNAHSVDTLTDSGFLTANTDYGNELSNYLKITLSSGSTYVSKDGSSYTISIGDAPTNTTHAAHKQRVGSVTIDINGATKPNAAGVDVFYFSWWNDGSLRPQGGTGWNGADSSKSGGTEHWKTKCPEGIVPSGGYNYCAGHVFENNFKVLYR